MTTGLAPSGIGHFLPSSGRTMRIAGATARFLKVMRDLRDVHVYADLFSRMEFYAIKTGTTTVLIGWL
jgi:hypothetical protein